jgi:predicted RNA-binding Zn-ribbon protein involved in translation (DUF1610 family)
MGEYSIFECSSCGYRSARIRWGVGENDQSMRFLVGICHHCRELVEIDLTKRDIMVDTFTCQECDSPVFFFEKAESYDCPRCGAPNMRIKQDGYW